MEQYAFSVVITSSRWSGGSTRNNFLIFLLNNYSEGDVLWTTEWIFFNFRPEHSWYTGYLWLGVNIRLISNFRIESTEMWKWIFNFSRIVYFRCFMLVIVSYHFIGFCAWNDLVIILCLVLMKSLNVFAFPIFNMFSFI